MALGVAAVVVALDQLTKQWAVSTLDTRTIHVLWTLRLNLTSNSGIAFGQAKGFGGASGIVAVIAVAVLVVVARRSRSRLAAVAAGLVAGGAVGNLLDRVFRDGPGSGPLHGAVVDFIDLQWWPVFNVADVGVTLGAIGLVLVGLRAEAHPKALAEHAAAPTAGRVVEEPTIDAPALDAPAADEPAVGEPAVGEPGRAPLDADVVEHPADRPAP